MALTPEQALLNHRFYLCEQDVTLNNRPARVMGARLDFPFVVDIETGLRAEWSWEAVERVIAKGGRFES